MTGPLRRHAVAKTGEPLSPLESIYPCVHDAKPTARFALRGRWYPRGMTATRGEARHDERPVLLFFSNRRSGPARRMASLVAWFGVTEKKRLRVVQVDTDANEDLANALEVSTVPTLVLLRGRKVLDRLDGRATGKQISRMISPHMASR